MNYQHFSNIKFPNDPLIDRIEKEREGSSTREEIIDALSPSMRRLQDETSTIFSNIAAYKPDSLAYLDAQLKESLRLCKENDLPEHAAFYERMLKCHELITEFNTMARGLYDTFTSTPEDWEDKVDAEVEAKGVPEEERFNNNQYAPSLGEALRAAMGNR